ncbi:alanine--tRNA ligase, partial [Alphaproteobacteria bacterium]|nr:alanine--tRNA ligase [Alphaproteobacteria bacterium]
MNSAEIRNTFLDYFKKNNHEIVHSSSLVPANDATLMFANSGMVQFKNIFTGKEKREYSRAVTSQKCVRAGGKHNDLENVGYTARHHTFFEMLGNFSFGDYFKDIAIELAWNLITKEFSIDKNKLLVTVYSDDEISLNYWKKIAGLSEDKIIKISTSDNFWSMGDTGPCGPCSEIFFDHGDKYFGGPPGSKNEDGDRFIEIWNLVFMQYEQVDKIKRIELPKPSIDTGMGLERVAALLQGTNDNYKTDIFTSLINKSIELSDNDNLKGSASHKVIADHLRSAAFLISDGVLPSNEGRGYVLRRIMRRGMRHAHTLGNKDPIFHKIFPILLNDMKDAYPELTRANDLIINTLFNEETKFKQTIDNGLKILEHEIKNTNNTFSGKVAFKLYDTYGFPLDLTQDFLKNKDIKVDIETFDNEMLDQKKRARKNWKGTGDIEDNKFWFELTKTIDPTEFLGYDQNKTQSIVLKIVMNDKITETIYEGDEACIILNQTTFYGESGGQIGDSGFLLKDNFQFKVSHTTKIFDHYFIHWGKVIKGQLSISDEITSTIDENKRQLIRNNHSSTHLLHQSLRQILGKHVTQKGSLVNEEKLRFDFSHNNPINLENMNKLENKVNSVIEKKYTVKTEILDHKSAINSGAMALFGEKYGDEVRVVSMSKKNKEEDNNIFSIELCGGTHVSNTGNIKDFKIINQSSVASGIRRIEAVTNIGVHLYN